MLTIAAHPLFDGGARRAARDRWPACIRASARPDVAIYAFAAAGLAFALSGGFAANATISAIVRLVTYAHGLRAAARLPAAGGDGGAGLPRFPPAPAVAVVGLGFCLWLLSTRTFTQAWILVALIAAGLAAGPWSPAGTPAAFDTGPRRTIGT